MEGHDHYQYKDVWGPQQVMVNVDGIIIYTKSRLLLDDDLAGEIFIEQEKLKVRPKGDT